MKRKAKKRKKTEEEALKQAKELAAQAQAVKEAQKKVVEASESEVDSLTRVDKDNLWGKDLIKLGEKLKEAIGMKQKMEEEKNRKVDNKVGDKKQVINRKCWRR